MAGEGGCSPDFPAAVLLPAAIFTDEPLWRGWCLISVGKSFPGPRRLRLRGQGGDQSSPRCWPWRAAARQGSPMARSRTPALRWLVLGRWGFYGCPVGARRRRPGLKQGFGLLGGRLGLQRPWRCGVNGDAHASALRLRWGGHGVLLTCARVRAFQVAEARHWPTRSRRGAPWPTVRSGGRESPEEGKKLTVGGVEDWMAMPCRCEVVQLRCGRAVPCRAVSVTKRRRRLRLRRPPPPRWPRRFLPLLPPLLPPLSWFRCAAYGHQMAAGDGRSLGLWGWGSYSRCSELYGGRLRIAPSASSGLRGVGGWHGVGVGAAPRGGKAMARA